MSITTYLVGGAVRDELLGQAVVDRDWVVVGATPEYLLSQGYRAVGNQFPCFLHPQTQEEYALARTERKQGQGHNGFICEFGPQVTLEEDLSRRDLTINAIARTAAGDYIDPFNGRQDLHNRLLRHVCPAFVEDPLRVLRVARFAARFADLGFSVHPDTLALMQQMAQSGELSSLTPERVWQETLRALAQPRPSVFFRLLHRCGALAAWLPELARLFGVPQSPQHHPEIDTGEHVMLSIDQARQRFDQPLITWAVLLHDLGKGITPQQHWPKHHRHEHLGVPLVQNVCARLKVPNEYRALAVVVCQYHLQCHCLAQLKPATILKLLEALDGFRRPQRVEQFAQACQADACGRLGLEHSRYPQAHWLMQCLQVARQTDIHTALQPSASGQRPAGAVIAQRIRKLRLRSIAQCKAQFIAEQAG